MEKTSNDLRDTTASKPTKRRKTTAKKKGSGLFMKLAVGVIIIQAIIYTWVHLYLSHSAGLEIAPTSTVAFYTFCLGELSVCGFIKNKK